MLRTRRMQVWDNNYFPSKAIKGTLSVTVCTMYCMAWESDCRQWKIPKLVVDDVTLLLFMGLQRQKMHPQNLTKTVPDLGISLHTVHSAVKLLIYMYHQCIRQLANAFLNKNPQWCQPEHSSYYNIIMVNIATTHTWHNVFRKLDTFIDTNCSSLFFNYCIPHKKIIKEIKDKTSTGIGTLY